jgi:hypothetical protein
MKEMSEMNEINKMNEAKEKAKPTKTSQTTLHPRTLIAVLLFLGLTTIARPAAAACSKASLTGTYGISWGWPQEMYAATGNEAMVVGQLTADGKGHLTGTETVSYENSIQTVSVTGTYTVAANCTGTISLSPDFFNIYLNSSNGGFQMTLTTTGFEAAGFALPQVSTTCALTGKIQDLGLNVVGTIPGSSVNVAIIGELVLNGKGKVTGTVSVNGNYSNSVKTVTGTYTEESNCTGTLDITPKGSPELHFNTVFVNGGTELLLVETDSGTVIGGTAQ